MQRISGKVVLKESGAGISDLVVSVHDVALETRPTTLHAAVLSADRDAALSSAGRRVGSVVTDATGAFELTYDDEAPTDGPAPDRRTGLFLVIQAPDEMRDGQDAAVLYASAAIRRRAGRVEQYVIRLTSEQLRAAGLEPPAGTSSRELERPESVLHEVEEGLKRQARIADEVQRISTEHVGKARVRARQVETAVNQRILEHLTGVPDRLRARLGFVAPDASRAQIETANWSTVARNVEQVVNKQAPRVGYIQVPDAELPRFQTADGEFRDDLPAELVEPFLFGDATGAGRTVERIREDPMELARKSEGRGASLGAALEESDSSGAATNGSVADTESDAPAASLSIDDLPELVGRLVGTVSSPEDGVLGVHGRRPTRDDVQRQTDGFKLRGGPADVPAIYDFHNLQIAFDHVWQHAIDEQVLERSQELCHKLIEAGADPIAGLEAGGDPLRALRSEVRIVRRTQAPAGVAPRMARPATVSAGTPESPRPLPPPPPPPPKPGFPFEADPEALANAMGLTAQRKEPHDLLDELEGMLQEPYKFEVFAPNTVNFGLNVTYRQRWEPITYQVGNLVKTITLTPKESRKVSVKRTLKKDRVVREMENNLRVRKDESSDTARDEAEIVRKAQEKTTFNVTAKGSYDIGISDGDSTTSFTKEASTDSSDVKKAFREAVIKAAQEFRDERKLEVETKESLDEEVFESTEISNPNDELTATYLFFELQRRFRVSEHLHRLTPVVLVAMEVPNPSRRSIDRLLLQHAWIFGRVLLDDRYRPALAYLTTCIVGDELALRELSRTVEKLRETVDRIETSHAELVQEVKTRNVELEAMMTARADKVGHEGGEGALGKAWDAVVGGGSGEDLEAARLREENAKATYERAVREEKELRESLKSETAALNAATQAYAKAFAEHANHMLQVAGLRVHVKANILYYMQAIWSHTFRDQIFFSLHKIKVPALLPRDKRYAVALPEEAPTHIVPKAGMTVLEVHCSTTLESPGTPEDDFVTLAEVADLDHPMGFKGNYMVFPLKRSNALTDFMMVPYVDAELGLHDPDELSTWSPDAFVEHVRSLRRTLPPDEFAAIEGRLAEQYRRIVSAPRRAEEEIVVPTTSLHIECLPGAHPNLEDYKLQHRAMDVQKVAEEVRKLKLEGLRYAARILSGEREDPDVERKIVIDGSAASVVVPPVEG